MKSAAQKRLAAAVLTLLVGLAPAAAQEAAPATPDGSLAEARAALVTSTEELKESTAELIRLEEEKGGAAAAKVEQLKQLFVEGLVSRSEVEAAEAALSDSRTRIESLRVQLTEADRSAEQAAELARAPILRAPAVAVRGAGRYSATTSLIRYTGRTSSAFSGLAGVQAFFASTFGRALPISAAGQSVTHDRFGYDHRHAVDVAVHPDSAEGRALIAHLQRQGITFIAFRSAIPGVATGPHIHIGRPSGRL